MEPVALVAGSVSFLVVLLAAVLLRRIPASRTCPSCRRPTAAMQSGFWLRLVRPKLHRRWCSDCGWTGLRRTRAPVGPGEEPLAHESGFHWGRPEASDAPLFVWRSRNEDDGSERRDEGGPAPGFRWKEAPSDEAPVFLWGDDGEQREAS